MQEGAASHTLQLRFTAAFSYCHMKSSANALLSHRPDTPSGVEGYPMREWSIKIYVLGPNGEELPATCFDKATYKLHESFGPRAKQSASPQKANEQEA